jgi:hypothetical protein
VYFCGIARSAFGCGIINLDLNDFWSRTGTHLISWSAKIAGKHFYGAANEVFIYFSRVHLSRLGRMAVFVCLALKDICFTIPRGAQFDIS